MKVRYSPIGPITLLEQLFLYEEDSAKPLLGNYLLLLAHDVLANPARYRALIIKVRMRAIERGWGDTCIIMDNSVVELGTALNFKLVLHAAEIVDATCVMTPDVLGNYLETMSQIITQGDALHDSHLPLMRVPQGETTDDIFLCVTSLRSFLPKKWGAYEVEYWGIPRWIANKHETRSSVIEFINDNALGRSDVHIHLLGMSNNMADDIYCCTLPNVVGIDSANPLVLGIAGVPLDVDKYVHVERGNYWSATTAYTQSMQNVYAMHALVAPNEI